MSPPGRALSRLAVAAVLVVGSIGCAIPRWPVDAPITSAYGVRFRGLLPGVHRGVDLGVPHGTPVRPMAPGTVRFAGSMDGYGTVVWLDHGGGVLTVYAHLSSVAVRERERVGGRTVIGRSGSSGNVSGPHLHFEVWRWGRQQDPVPLLGGFPDPG